MVAGIVCRVAERAFVADADVRREAAAELVAQAQAGFDLVEAAADAVLGFILAGHGRFQQGLQDQPVGQQHVVFDFGLGHQLATGAGIQRGRAFELVRRQPLDADRRPGA
ncbi:hypothetical protein D3C73_1377970 [compost metagenome]